MPQAWGGGPCKAWWRGNGPGNGGSRANLESLRRLPLHHPSGGPPPHLRWGGKLMVTRVKTAKGRKVGSTKWLERQLNDPYVKRAKAEGYRSRAAYKLI